MKVIQVGIGGMGNAWLGAAQRSPQVGFAGFVEIDKEIARAQSEAYNLDRALIFESLPAALEAVEADAVINVTPPEVHRQICVCAMEAGLPVLTEKPLAGSLDDARAIVETANATGILCSVAQNYRYRPLTQTIKAILAGGELGTVAALRCEFFRGPHFGGFRERMAQPLIIDMSIHHFDLMRLFLDSDALSISARSWNPPWSWFDGDASAAAQIEFANGAQASYIGSWCSQALETSWNANWRFECERGALLVEDDRVTAQQLLSVDEGARGLASQHGEVRAISPIGMERESQDYLLHEFYEAVMRGESVATTAQDNIHTVEFVFGVVEACDSGGLINL
ncbi:MAG: Gfo/Idh/MocA family oxidoreductase [Chloroflexota bacterium]|nr:Gfo/Idh/MocA family oxidoreductase [Chloroflexota bacterium]MDE2910658.1 Gfo/Idh/MocA family oxidoreductase [Chloroflexota bacterium]